MSFSIEVWMTAGGSPVFEGAVCENSVSEIRNRVKDKLGTLVWRICATMAAVFGQCLQSTFPLPGEYLAASESYRKIGACSIVAGCRFKHG